MNKPLVIAHRGVTENNKHENTICAFKEAIEMNLDAIELDIHRTSDGVFVVHHNPDVNEILISTLKFDELKNIELKYSIPTIDEVIDVCTNNIYLDIELKEEGYEVEFVKHILKFISYDQFSIRSFCDKSIKIIKKYDKRIRTGLLLGVGKPKYGFITRLSELFPLFRIINSKCDFVSPHYLLLKFGYVKRMHILKKPVITWTVNTKEIMVFNIVNKVDAIITDKPSLLKEEIKKMNL